jgi:hypothetical protein
MDIQNKKSISLLSKIIRFQKKPLSYIMTKNYVITSPQPSLDNLGRYYESDYISHTDSKRSLFEKAYHLVKNIALKTNCNLSIRSK